MTRSERLAKLRHLRQSIPINDAFYIENLFIPWQGQVSGLLTCNPKLQKDFQGAVSSIEQPGTIRHEFSLKRANRVILLILEQAIGELELPEEPARLA